MAGVFDLKDINTLRNNGQLTTTINDCIKDKDDAKFLM